MRWAMARSPLEMANGDSALGDKGTNPAEQFLKQLLGPLGQINLNVLLSTWRGVVMI